MIPISVRCDLSPKMYVCPLNIVFNGFATNLVKTYTLHLYSAHSVLTQNKSLSYRFRALILWMLTTSLLKIEIEFLAYLPVYILYFLMCRYAILSFYEIYCTRNIFVETSFT